MRRRLTARRQPGQAMAEMSLILGLFLLIILGGLTYLGFVNDAAVVTRAAGEGANTASLSGGDVGAVQAAVHSALRGGGLDPAQAAITVDWPEGQGRYQPIQVTVRYTTKALAGGAMGLPKEHTIIRAFTRASEVDGSASNGPRTPLLPGAADVPGGAP